MVASFTQVQAAVDHGLRLADEGADILDIGGELTRPGSEAVPLDEELRRVIPVIEGLRAKTDKLISIDTRKAEVMRQAAAAGADILNDVSALTHDPKALDTAAETGLPVMLMHAQGDPKTMNDNPQYCDVVLDVFDFLEQRIRACVAAGIPKAKIDRRSGHRFRQAPASQRGRALSHEPLSRPRRRRCCSAPSRKKLIGQLCNIDDPERARAGFDCGGAVTPSRRACNRPRSRCRGHAAGRLRVGSGAGRNRSGLCRVGRCLR